MTEVERILDQCRRAFEGNAWHGPALLELLSDVKSEDAAAHPIAAVHSIWEIVLHIAAWKNACNRRLEGDRAQLTDTEDWPIVRQTTSEKWQDAKDNLLKNHQQLLEAISRLDEWRLDTPVIEGMSSVYITLQGVVQHDLYHAGQIAILKRALGPA
jgi:uncharacterized damage-inducible protein DinB